MIKRLAYTGEMYRKKGSERPVTGANAHNTEIVEDLVIKLVLQDEKYFTFFLEYQKVKRKTIVYALVEIKSEISYEAHNENNFSKVKENSKFYSSHLKAILLPTCDLLSAIEKYFFVQDGVTSHIANITVEHLRETFAHRFIQKNQWPPSSTDCNPLNYFFLGHNQMLKGQTTPFQKIFN